MLSTQMEVEMPVFMNISVESWMMQSSQSFSRIYCRMLLGPLPASPLNRGEPFWIMAILPLFASLARPFSTKSC